MSAKKVLQAYKFAKLSEAIADVVFVVEDGSASYITIGGKRLLEFDRKSEADKIAKSLNDAIGPVLTQIKASYDSRIEEILNA